MRVWAARRVLAEATRAEACHLGCLERCQRAARSIVKRDRRLHYESKADEAMAANSRGDTKEVFAITRVLAGAPPRRSAAIKHEDGRTLTDPDEITQRWTRHFSEVFDAKVIKREVASVVSDWSTNVLIDRIRQPTTWALTCQEMATIIRKLPKNKGRGPDQLPAEAIQAAEVQCTEFLYELLEDMAVARHIPFQWKGGKILPIWKKNGVHHALSRLQRHPPGTPHI